MKKNVTYVLVMIFGILSGVQINAQVKNTGNDKTEGFYERQKRFGNERKIYQNTENSLEELSKLGNTTPVAENPRNFRVSKTKETEKKLVVEREDLLRYKSFLKKIPARAFLNFFLY